MSDLLRACVAHGAGYVPGEQPRPGERLVKLNTNENPYPPSPRALAALQEAAPDLRLYPEPTHRLVREAVAAAYGVEAGRVVVGNGSDELLALLLRACVGEGQTVAAPMPTYTLYRNLSQLHGAVFEEHPFPEDFSLPASLFGTRARLVFLCNPNSPSGTTVSASEVERLARAIPGLLAVDEAYVEFGAETCLGLAARSPNVAVVRTLSKSHSLAGLRVGWAYGSPELVAGLDKLRDSYNLDRLAQAAAAAALLDHGHLRANLDRVVSERERLAARLTGLGFHVWPSRSNFLLARWKAPAGPLQAELRRRGVLVRHFATPRLENCLRVSVGKPEENDAFLKALEDLLV